MASSDKFCLKWNDFENNISQAFRELREDKDFFDVTLACDDEQLQAHKVILSACSPFFRTILRRNHHSHPLLYLKGIKFSDLLAVLNFMYHGEVNVAQEELNSFLAVAEDLKVKGLTQNSSENDTIKAQPTGSISRDNAISAKTGQPDKRPRQLSAQKVALTSYHGDDDIEEVVPVKTEPLSLPPDTETHSLEHKYSTPHIDPMATGVLADPNIEYGEEYDDYGTSYEGQVDGSFGASVMETSMQAMGGQDQGNKDFVNEFTEAVEELLIKSQDSSGHTLWQCAKCDKTAKIKIHLREHVETHHIENFNIYCSICSKQYRTRKSMRTHYMKEHSMADAKFNIFRC